MTTHECAGHGCGAETEAWLRGLSRAPTAAEVDDRQCVLADYFEHEFDPADPAPWCSLTIGPDARGRLLEIGIVEDSDGHNVVVHAMELRATWYRYALGSATRRG